MAGPGLDTDGETRSSTGPLAAEKKDETPKLAGICSSTCPKKSRIDCKKMWSLKKNFPVRPRDVWKKNNFRQCKKFFLNMPLDCTKLNKTNAKTNDRFQANAHAWSGFNSALDTDMTDCDYFLRVTPALTYLLPTLPSRD
jgi:hypothetical protein